MTSLPSLFGDISGLKDFFNFLIVLFIGGFQTKMYHFSQLRTFFRYNSSNEIERPGESMDVAKTRNRFTKLQLNLLDKLKFSLLYEFCLSRHSLRKKKIFDRANAKLNKALDARTITHHQRVLSILMNLTLSKISRKLLYLQRRTTVLDLKKEVKGSESANLSSSSSDFESGSDDSNESRILSKITALSKQKIDESRAQEIDLVELALRQGVR